MKIIFFLPTGMVEYPVPTEIEPTFNFNAMASSTRINGFFLSDNLYLRHSQIVGMALDPENGRVPLPVRRDLN